ncbi:MAG: HD domain-containing protein [Gemmatimonadales bacterium]|nr:MAG: HD domain-containing protein [Gemmatimonadales bacterium]
MRSLTPPRRLSIVRRSPVSGLRSPVSGLRSPVSGARLPKPPASSGLSRCPRRPSRPGSRARPASLLAPPDPPCPARTGSSRPTTPVPRPESPGMSVDPSPSGTETSATSSPTALRILRDAAEGRLPDWAVAGKSRRRHMERVAGLLDEWADARQLGAEERVRWRAAGFLHDVLREATPSDLRPRVPVQLRALSGPLLHGPAAAERLRDEGVGDEAFLRAIAFHTIGHPDFDALGQALYCADYLEPGRRDPEGWKAKRRARFPKRPDFVTFEVLRARIRTILEAERRLPDATVAFWNQRVGKDAKGGGRRPEPPGTGPSTEVTREPGEERE